MLLWQKGYVGIDDYFSSVVRFHNKKNLNEKSIYARRILSEGFGFINYAFDNIL